MTSTVIDTAFLNELIKRSTAAEMVMMDSGLIRLEKTAKAVVELYLEKESARRTGRTDGKILCEFCRGIWAPPYRCECKP